jgi:hypothetical protein
MGAPGATFETIDLNRPPVQRLRTDICGFLGYAERGPLDRPVKLTGWRQFIDAFGPPLAFSHTGHAIRLFFDNGGAQAYMMRVAHRDGDRAARTASVDVVPGLTLSASFSAIGKTATQATGPTADPADLPSPSPGSWGNRLSLVVQAGGLGATRSLANQPDDGGSIRVENIAGFSPGSWVKVIQDGNVSDAYAQVAEIDPLLKEITWATPIGGLDFAAPILLETVEFGLRVQLDGQDIGGHDNLSLDPRHPRWIVTVLETDSPVLAAVANLDPMTLADPALWPIVGSTVGLRGGRDGLADVLRQDFLDALALYAAIDEISVLAAPDVVLDAEAAPEEEAVPPPLHDCLSVEPPSAGQLRGQVFDADSGAGLGGVLVSARDVAATPALTSSTGIFTLTALPVGQVAIRLERDGYATLAATAQTFAVPPPGRQRFEMAARTLPPALADDDVFLVQQAMAAQGEQGLYRIALFDAPAGQLAVADIQGWRRRFDTTYAALYWPWVMTTLDDGTTRALPPSGAVAGLLARLDLEEGPQRAPANRPLRGIEALTVTVDDPIHGLLNDSGINVLRATPGRGIAPQGARTLSSDPEWRFLNVRRLMLLIAEAIEDAHQWAVFEPNNRVLRDALSHSLTSFLAALWLRGAFAGGSPSEAYAVKCDEENNPPAVIDAGQVIAQIAVAPVRPYEFIRLRLGRSDRVRVQEDA